MNIAQNIEIHFHQQNQVSIFHEINVSGDDEKTGEIAGLTLFALRMMSNLGANDTSDSLGSILAGAAEIVPEFAARAATESFQLIQYPGYQGRKRFLATLRMTDDSTRFDMKAKGFGWLATGVGYYGPVSVVALLRYLAENHSNDTDFLQAVVVAAEMCGHLQLRRQISLTNQLQLALMTIATACENYMHKTDDRSTHMNRRVNPSTMKTEVGRELAGRLNRNLETSDTQLHRLTQVLDEYIFYIRDLQLDLADAAIVYAFSGLASHGRRDECKSNLHALADLMYVATEDAINTLTESDRQQIAVAAAAVRHHVTAGVREVLRESVQQLLTYDEHHTLRIAAEMLHRVSKYLDHALPPHLSNLIGHCFVMCDTIDGYELGIGSVADLVPAISNVTESCSRIATFVHDAVKSGSLAVKDGVIVNPNNDA
jgi:hypothetical protein